ncbi:hypothetical protein K438DRAFT_1991798 [Mycena galopus ATCC 62051]|nr:hypothetical protein K438DRAFT_1991798 [Mycena galopus ATCC 62051]
MASTPLSSLSHVSRARSPFLSAATAALLLYDPNGHHAPSNAASFFVPLLKDPASFLQTKINVVLAIHLPTDLHATESLEGFDEMSPVCVSPSSRPTFSRPLSLTAPCAYAPCPLAPADIDAASAPAIHICTDFVQSPRRRLPPNPPVPSSTIPLAALDSISEGLCAPLTPTCLAVKQQRRPSGNWAAWAPAAM